MEEGIGLLRKYKDLLQDFHWNTAKDYAKHLLFERLMNDVSDLLDRYVEVTMGSRGIEIVDIEKIKSNIDFDGNLEKFIKEAKSWFIVDMVSAKESEMNVLGDILEMFDRHLYLL